MDKIYGPYKSRVAVDQINSWTAKIAADPVTGNLLNPGAYNYYSRDLDIKGINTDKKTRRKEWEDQGEKEIVQNKQQLLQLDIDDKVYKQKIIDIKEKDTYEINNKIHIIVMSPVTRTGNLRFAGEDMTAAQICTFLTSDINLRSDVKNLSKESSLSCSFVIKVVDVCEIFTCDWVKHSPENHPPFSLLCRT